MHLIRSVGVIEDTMIVWLNIYIYTCKDDQSFFTTQTLVEFFFVLLLGKRREGFAVCQWNTTVQFCTVNLLTLHNGHSSGKNDAWPISGSNPKHWFFPSKNHSYYQRFNLYSLSSSQFGHFIEKSRFFYVKFYMLFGQVLFHF